MSRPRLGVFGLTGCAGDQLVLLNCEDELPELACLTEVRDFLMASSANDACGEPDVALVEGAVAGRRDEERLRAIRRRSKTLVAIGSCAVWGGVSAAETPDRHADRLAEVYGPAGLCYDSAPARPLRELVRVDWSLPGCPIEKHELLELMAHLLEGNLPPPADRPVCAECRMAENDCLLARGAAVCCGPLTVGGCRARCPEMGVPCIGCRGRLRRAGQPANRPAAGAAVAGREHPKSRPALLLPGPAGLPGGARSDRSGRRAAARGPARPASQETGQPDSRNGRRAVHPVNAVPGGLARLPGVEQLVALQRALEQGLRDAEAAVELTRRLELIARAYGPCLSCSVHVVRRADAR